MGGKRLLANQDGGPSGSYRGASALVAVALTRESELETAVGKCVAAILIQPCEQWAWNFAWKLDFLILLLTFVKLTSIHYNTGCIYNAGAGYKEVTLKYHSLAISHGHLSP